MCVWHVASPRSLSISAIGSRALPHSSSSDLRPRGRIPRCSELRFVPNTSLPPIAPLSQLLDPEPLRLCLRQA
ncbi:hypothetical protein NL676_014109 [Syzygium grande]|nr:hypothetical protein NL676_014109 [Syzygium grande]